MAAVAAERLRRSPAQSFTAAINRCALPQSREWSNWPAAVIMLAVLCLISLLAVSGCKPVSPGDQGTERSSLEEGHRQEIPGVDPPASPAPPEEEPNQEIPGVSAAPSEAPEEETNQEIPGVGPQAEEPSQEIPGVSAAPSETPEEEQNQEIPGEVLKPTQPAPEEE